MLKEIKKIKKQFTLTASDKLLQKLKYLKYKEKININKIIEHYVEEGIKKDYPNLDKEICK